MLELAREAITFTIADQNARDFDEYELESEKAGPVFQIMARYAF